MTNDESPDLSENAKTTGGPIPVGGPPTSATPSSADRRRERLIAHWARAPYWSLEDGAVLAYDLDPKEAIERPVTGYDHPRLRAPADARRLLDFARRAVEVGSLEERSAPIAFMKWARSVDVEFHSGWWKAMGDATDQAGPEVDGPPPFTPVPELTTKEQDTLLKMVAGMALAFYGWDREALRNKATGEIASDLALAGVPLDPDTIRKWLKRSADLIPPKDA